MDWQNFNIFTFPILLMFVSISGNGCAQPDSNTEKRRTMVYEQIQARGINNKRVLNAMLKVERHLFVPKTFIDEAYDDHPIPIGYSQTISQPYIVGFMTEIICKENPHKVLEIGTGSGYQAAILAELCDSVYTIDIIPELVINAQLLLDSLNYKNIFIKNADGYKGWEEYAPFDAIIVTCAPTHIPLALQTQLAEGGRMVIPVGRRENQELILIRKKNGKLYRENILPVLFVPMIDEKYNAY